jgi:hypothetical protein
MSGSATGAGSLAITKSLCAGERGMF